VRVGDVCLAVGNPLGIGETVTSGIISAKGRSTDLGDGSFQNFLQTDAPINQGNSGGALVDTRGELIGINSQIISPNGGSVGIGFAIPSDMAKSVMDQLLSHGKVQRGLMGVGIQDVTGELAASLGMKEARGVLVNSVTPDGPADKAGVKTGDVILKLNGKDVNDGNALRNEVAGTAPGTEMTATILRDGKEQDMHLTLGELTPQGAQQRSSRGGEGESPAKLGITVGPITPEIASQLGLPRGTQGLVVESVDPGGAAAEAGIEEGDIIQEVNRQPVRSAQDMRSAFEKTPAGRAPLLLINRGGQTVFVPVPVK
jgi:S1-C subfamily serine protease